eukprot:JZ548965.1.p1 GENE.JZ548965.1~~JZ548965.1.p1  ORF type:complete len:205 (+),score=24.44 JZ548965.1:83-697(+)
MAYTCTLLGQRGVGKTNLCISVVSNDFSHEYLPTKKKETYAIRVQTGPEPDDWEVMELEDCPGVSKGALERLFKLSEREAKPATDSTPLLDNADEDAIVPQSLCIRLKKHVKVHGFFVAFDFGSLPSFLEARDMVTLLGTWCGFDYTGTSGYTIPVILLGMKDDLPKQQRQVTEEHLEAFAAHTNGTVPFFSVCARFMRGEQER